MVPQFAHVSSLDTEAPTCTFLLSAIVIAVVLLLAIDQLVAKKSSKMPSAPETTTPARMTQESMEEILRRHSTSASGGRGQLEFEVNGVSLMCVSDVMHDRMRIIATVAQEADLSVEEMRRVLNANFHTALDGRYALHNGVLYAAYIHPLSPLREDQLVSAMRQVASLVRTFGTAYTGGALQYVGGGMERSSSARTSSTSDSSASNLPLGQ